MEHEEPGRTIACGFRIGVQDVGKSQAGEGLILRMKRLKPLG
ncbi:MAG: hypothetical protein WBJ40_02025 [Methanoculleus sp.]|nr:hypothetical protein [Methanoculleus sp.]